MFRTKSNDSMFVPTEMLLSRKTPITCWQTCHSLVVLTVWFIFGNFCIPPLLLALCFISSEQSSTCFACKCVRERSQTYIYESSSRNFDNSSCSYLAFLYLVLTSNPSAKGFFLLLPVGALLFLIYFKI